VGKVIIAKVTTFTTTSTTDNQIPARWRTFCGILLRIRGEIPFALYNSYAGNGGGEQLFGPAELVLACTSLANDTKPLNNNLAFHLNLCIPGVQMTDFRERGISCSNVPAFLSRLKPSKLQVLAMDAFRCDCKCTMPPCTCHWYLPPYSRHKSLFQCLYAYVHVHSSLKRGMHGHRTTVRKR
jgi:hypothetical protein